MSSCGDAVDAYLADPSPTTLARLRRTVRAARNFSTDLTVGETVRSHLDRGCYDAAVSAIEVLMPGATFSPSAHAALAEALARTGRQEAADREASLARAALRSIVSTGDGTVARPWSVLRISDEYDVLRSLGKRPREQTVVRDGDRHLDRHACTDGSDVYFDVSELFPRG